MTHNKNENGMTVSPQTQGFIDCITSLYKHRDMVFDALAVMYHKETAYNELDKIYDPVFRPMIEVLQKFMVESIMFNIIEYESTEI